MSYLAEKYNKAQKQDRYVSPFDLLLNYSEERAAPTFCTFELTRFCPFRCNMCYMATSNETACELGSELTTEQWKRLAVEALDLGTLCVTLTGGEPLTRPDFREIYEYIDSLGMTISILTNAYYIDEEFVEWLTKRPPLSMGISLYGASNETYEKLCHVKDGFDKAFHAIKLLEEANINIMIKFLCQEETLCDMQTVQAWAKGRNWKFLLYSLTENTRMDTHRCNKIDCIDVTTGLPLEHKDRNEFIAELEKLDSEKAISLKQSLDQTNSFYTRKDDGYTCTAGRSRFWITWYGAMQSCAMFEEPASYPLVEGMEKAWMDLRSEMSKYNNPDECFNCRLFGLCRKCPATHYLDTGKRNCVSDRVCDDTISRILHTLNSDRLLDKEGDCNG